MSAFSQGLFTKLRIDTPSERLYNFATHPGASLSLGEREDILGSLKTNKNLSLLDADTMVKDRTRVGAIGGAAIGAGSLLALNRLGSGVDRLSSVIETNGLPFLAASAIATAINNHAGMGARDLLGRAAPLAGISGEGTVSTADIRRAMEELPRKGLGVLRKHRGLVESLKNTREGGLPINVISDMEGITLATAEDKIRDIRNIRSKAQRLSLKAKSHMKPSRIVGLGLLGSVAGALLSRANAKNEIKDLRDMTLGVTNPKDIALDAVTRSMPAKKVTDYDFSHPYVDRPFDTAAGIVDLLSASSLL